jgi:hypothetical protein
MDTMNSYCQSLYAELALKRSDIMKMSSLINPSDSTIANSPHTYGAEHKMWLYPCFPMAIEPHDVY